MTNILKTTILAAFISLASCSNDPGDKLEGKWQLRQTEQDGRTIQVDTVFYNFQTSLFMYQIYNPATDGVSQTYGYKYLETDNILTLELDSPPEAFMARTDWANARETFTIETLTRNQLILTRDNKRYHFRKH